MSKYMGFTVSPEFCTGDVIKWKITGNGEYILGTKDSEPWRGKKWFIKRDINIRYPSKMLSAKVYDDYAKIANAALKKQRDIRRNLSDLNERESNLILVEADNFFDKENRFVTITEMIPDCYGEDEKLTSLSKDEFLGLAKQSAEMLSALHQRGVIHGDIKEANILVRKADNTPCLIDFDSSYLKGEIPGYEDIGGTEGYLSPEQISYGGGAGKVNPDVITEKTDIFSLGIVFHRWWSGAFPSVVSESCTVGQAVLNDKKIKIDAKFEIATGADGGSAFSSLINWMLAKDPENRPSAEQVYDVLSGNANVDPEFEYCGNSDKFKLELWPSHADFAKLISLSGLKKKGITAFEPINNGTGGRGLRYSVQYKDGTTADLSINELFDKGYALNEGARLCEPWEEHSIMFASPEEIVQKGYAVINRASALRKEYNLKTISGIIMNKSCAWVVSQGLAHYVHSDIEADKPWPEHGAEYNFEIMSLMKVVKICRAEWNGRHCYNLVYDQIIDGKQKVSENVPANNVRLMGFIK